MHHNQRVSRLRPAHIVNDAAADGGGQVVVSAAVDVGLHYAILDDIHAVMRKAQHVGIIDRK